MPRREIDLDALSPEEQLELLDRLVGATSGRSPDLFPLTEPQRREIDARSEELDRALAAGEPCRYPMGRGS